VIVYKLPSVGKELKLDRRCPHCGCPNGNIHSCLRQRWISDPKACHVAQRRMRCPRCGSTWTIRAEGVGHGRHRSELLRGLGVILYMLGPSYEAAAGFLQLLGCRASSSGIERDVEELGSKARWLHESSLRMGVRILGVDGTGAAMAGRNAGMLFFVDIEGQRLLLAVALQETDAQKVRQLVSKVMRQVGAKELRTDEHRVYQGIVPEEQHRLCLTHWRKSKGKRAYDLYQKAVAENRPLEAQTMLELLDILRKQPRAPTVPAELERLVRRYINARKGLPWKVNQLLQHVERTWSKVSCDPFDATNNVTERVIGLTFKIRAKTMRGFKSISKAVAHPYLSSLLRGEAGVCDLRKVI